MGSIRSAEQADVPGGPPCGTAEVDIFVSEPEWDLERLHLRTDPCLGGVMILDTRRPGQG